MVLKVEVENEGFFFTYKRFVVVSSNANSFKAHIKAYKDIFKHSKEDTVKVYFKD